ncbi:hypothetical protein DFA_06843 [Cavenderia fasciculata]|uniref:Uncharacterized protein n=1 Tax=Cavenderia fasciculata TaxID=261658 RepID=F4Q2F6_CACFS|nr:uncharacterized protein DFA_06843 [Cavenderia fasciculata]EGG18176.1 hypothetical protein DFA_06843 [Cavenderia fasciculata]|eukprot:XP_004366217.1 hypothetical protein DFA_06843 [Cavenderia fasciculata]
MNNSIIYILRILFGILVLVIVNNHLNSFGFGQTQIPTALIISDPKILNIKTKIVDFTFSVPSENGMVFCNISLNNTMTYTEVRFSDVTNRLISINLPSGTTTNVGLVAYDFYGVSNTLYFKVTTYPVISNLTKQVLQAYDLSTNDPNDWTMYNGSIIYYMPDFVTDPQNLSLMVNNDGTDLTLYTQITFYYFPTINSTNSTSDYESIYLTWISDGGMPGNITYQVSVSNPKSSIQVPLVWCSGANINSCLITGLTSNTEYSVDIKMSSIQFLPINQTILVSTLQHPNNYTCIDRQGINNTIECNGFGECLNRTCRCVNNRVGLYCGTVKPGGGGGNGDGGRDWDSHVEPSLNNPKIVTNNADIFYQFVVSQIRELDVDQNIIKSLDLTTLNWEMTNQTNQPTNISPLILLNNWIYSTNSDGSFYNTIKITFSQYVQQQEEEDDEEEEETTPKDIRVTFAGQLFYLAVGSIKYTIEIEGWSFEKSQQHMSYSFITTIPYFNLNAVFDPDLQLMINVDTINQFLTTPSKKWKIIVGVVIGVATLISISIATIIYKIKMDKEKKYKARLQLRTI